jgi:hypothetical protein
VDLGESENPVEPALASEDAGEAEAEAEGEAKSANADA